MCPQASPESLLTHRDSASGDHMGCIHETRPDSQRQAPSHVNSLSVFHYGRKRF